jgi:hypothetical protein
MSLNFSSSASLLSKRMLEGLSLSDPEKVGKISL